MLEGGLLDIQGKPNSGRLKKGQQCISTRNTTDDVFLWGSCHCPSADSATVFN